MSFFQACVFTLVFIKSHCGLFHHDSGMVKKRFTCEVACHECCFGKSQPVGTLRIKVTQSGGTGYRGWFCGTLTLVLMQGLAVLGWAGILTRRCCPIPGMMTNRRAL